MVYFLSPDEQRHVERGLLPQARRQRVADDLRGWSWQRPPLQAFYREPLGVHEVADKYCPTGRDLFLRKIERVGGPHTVELSRGKLYHALIAELMTRAKQLVYAHGVDCIEHLERLAVTDLELTSTAAVNEDTLHQHLCTLQRFELRRIVERVGDVLARQPHAGSDALAMLALPVSVEMKLDGRHLGLSQHLSVDGVSFPNLTVFELKFGQRRDFHRLSTTGYALVIESLFEVPIDVGCVVYVRLADGRVSLERDFHLIDDELRQVFIEERDEKMRLIAVEIDPGLPNQCPSSCPYLRACYPVQLTAASKQPASANQSGAMPDGIPPAA